MARDRLQIYETKEVRVIFDPEICIHSRVCLRSLPAVFDVTRKRWVRPENASPAEVIDAVARCPSGALQAYMVTSVHPTISPTVGKAPGKE